MLTGTLSIRRGSWLLNRQAAKPHNSVNKFLIVWKTNLHSIALSLVHMSDMAKFRN